MLPDPEEQPVLRLWPDVAKVLGLGRSAVYEAHRRGELPFVVWRVGGRLLVPTAAVRRALQLDPEHDEGAPPGAHVVPLAPVAKIRGQDGS